MTDASNYVEGRTGPWEIVLGLEVHAQVASKSKLFSGAAVGFGAGPNAQVSLVDAAMPGMLPVINGFCVEQAVRTGLGIGAQIHEWSRFDRKNYFFPDLPQGYQISQFAHPIVGEGVIEVERDDGSTFTVGIERLHLEQDAGKSIHDLDPDWTYVDLNRAGTALMEIVSKPDMRTSEEAAAYVKKLRSILRYLGTCDGDMEKGNLRADVNVSVRRPGGPLGTRCEIKNVNSYRYIQQAIEYEARRQIEILEDGGKIDQETRLFDPGKLETRSMRSKENADDYRYFPDPDLLPLELDPAWIEAIKLSLPELPDAKKVRLQEQYGLTAYDAGVLIIDSEKANFFENAAVGRNAKLVANVVTQDLSTRVNAEGLSWNAQGLVHFVPAGTVKIVGHLPTATYKTADESSDAATSGGVFTPAPAGDVVPVTTTTSMIGELVGLVESNEISSKIARVVFEHMWAGEGSPAEIVNARGLKQVTDTGAIEAVIDSIIAANPDKAAAVKDRPQAIGWFVGQVMKETAGKASPGAVNELLKKKLGVE